MDMEKNLKLAVYDPDMDDEFLFGVDFSKEKIIFSFAKEELTSECATTFKDFATSLHVIVEILYAKYTKES